jgi:XTP/dITP diphosphohydrolase
LVYLRHAADPCPLIAEGAWEGVVARAPRGDGGFGYDPLFIVPEYQRTFGELAPAVKAVISHRGRAMRAILPALVRAVAATG